MGRSLALLSFSQLLHKIICAKLAWLDYKQILSLIEINRADLGAHFNYYEIILDSL